MLHILGWGISGKILSIFAAPGPFVGPIRGNLMARAAWIEISQHQGAWLLPRAPAHASVDAAERSSDIKNLDPRLMRRTGPVIMYREKNESNAENLYKNH